MSNSVFIDHFTLGPTGVCVGGGTFMHVKDPRAPPSEERINPVTELTWQLRGGKGAQYVQRLKGTVKFFSKRAWWC